MSKGQNKEQKRKISKKVFAMFSENLENLATKFCKNGLKLGLVIRLNEHMHYTIKPKVAAENGLPRWITFFHRIPVES